VAPVCQCTSQRNFFVLLTREFNDCYGLYRTILNTAHPPDPARPQRLMLQVLLLHPCQEIHFLPPAGSFCLGSLARLANAFPCRSLRDLKQEIRPPSFWRFLQPNHEFVFSSPVDPHLSSGCCAPEPMVSPTRFCVRTSFSCVVTTTSIQRSPLGGLPLRPRPFPILLSGGPSFYMKNYIFFPRCFHPLDISSANSQSPTGPGPEVFLNFIP